MDDQRPDALRPLNLTPNLRRALGDPYYFEGETDGLIHLAYKDDNQPTGSTWCGLSLSSGSNVWLRRPFMVRGDDCPECQRRWQEARAMVARIISTEEKGG